MTFQISEFSKQIEDLKKRADIAFIAAGQCYMPKENNNDIVRLVFAGQYSAGKSSIIKMLTGRDDIAIGAGITTQKAHTYNWNGMEIIDTPGIHTELRPDHDLISYDAIASADMLVFVITNELFDSFLADHFRKLAIDKDKAGEMILVVNKMDRTVNGNTVSQQDIIREDLRKVLDPYTPEQLSLCFLDTESYLDSLSERAHDPELADELKDRSGFEEFVETLNRFVAKKQIASKITTSLYQLDEQLSKAIHDLEPKNADEDILALEEHYLQQRHIIINTRSQLQQEIGAIFSTATAQIRNLGLDGANLLVEGCKQEDVEMQLSDLVREVENITDQCQFDVDQLIEKRFTEMGQHLESNEKSEFAQTLCIQLIKRFDTLPENLKKMFNDAGPGLQKIGQVIGQKAYKAGVNNGLKLANFAGGSVHDWILKVGHFLKHKFKPWEAVKWAKGVAIGAHVLNAFGVGLQVFMQLKADHDEDQARVELKRNRQNIRMQFNNTANDFDAYGKQYIQECINLPLDEPIKEIDAGLSAIRESRKHQSNVLKELESIQHECQELVHVIHHTFHD